MSAHVTRGRLIAAFAAVYLVWGSTYLAILYAIDTIPPYLMSGSRFLVSGVVLYVFAILRSPARPTRVQWRDATITGVLMLAGGNGAVVWAEQRVPSGLAALLVSVVPVWVVLIDWLRPGGVRPSGRTFLGLGLGVVGLSLLVGPTLMGSSRAEIEIVGAIALMLGSISWAFGSIYNRQGARPSSPLLSTGMQMLGGSVAMIAIAAFAGEFGRFDPGAVTASSALAWFYLTTVGSLVGFTAYIYLLSATTPARATTYAYVNPVVAVLLGWAFAGETISFLTMGAAAVILTGVALITLG